MSYLQHVSPRNAPQTEAASRKQVKNSAGGYTFKLEPMKRLERFLILGSEKGTYYAGERKLTRENATCVIECFEADPQATVDLIVDVSVNGRAPKNDSSVFALGLCASQSGPNSQIAFRALPRVCRTGTDLFSFVEIINELRGWGSTARQGVGAWYTGKTADSLAMQVTKYAQRNGWSHRDVLRLCHAKTAKKELQDVLQYVAQRDKWLNAKRAGHRLLVTVEEAKTASTKQLIKWIHEEGLVREHLPTEALNDIGVWKALLENMPATAMLRNLAKMTSIGLLKPLSAATSTVCQRLSDAEFLKRGRLHPFNLLTALKVYKQGYGEKGSLTWGPVPQVMSALNVGFMAAFGAIQPTNKRFILGIDVSGSMSSACMGSNMVQCREAAAVMAMVAMKTEPASYAFGFTDHFQNLGLHAGMSLDEVCRAAYRSNFGRTDCSIPMEYAIREKIEADVFCVYTDNETYVGRRHPHIALEDYRQKMGIDAKLVVFGMAATNFTIANPDDPGMLDVVGFDTAAPNVVADFVRGGAPQELSVAA